MYTFAGILFVVIGVAALARAGRGLYTGRIWREPRRVKFDPRWKPGRWVERGDRGEFGVTVFYYVTIGVLGVPFGLRWLIVGR